MRTIEFTPTWRTVTGPLALYELPTAGWFGARRHVRFTLLADGTMLFGCGNEILHKDVCLYADDERGGTLMAGAFVRLDGTWVAYCFQYFAAHSTRGWEAQDRRSLWLARALLPRFDYWEAIIEAMGNDPIADSTIERRERAEAVAEEWEAGEAELSPEEALASRSPPVSPVPTPAVSTRRRYPPRTGD